MNICILFPKDSLGFFDPQSKISFGGATVQLHIVAQEMHAQRNDVTALIPDYTRRGTGTPLSYPAQEAYNTRSPLPAKFLQLLRILRREKPACVFQRGISPLTLPFCLLLKMLGIRSVFMFAHDVETHGIYQNSRKRYHCFDLLLRAADVLVCQNVEQKKNLPVSVQHKVLIFKKGIHISEIPSQSTEKVYNALWVARCEKWKNPELFISLSGKFPDMRFAMVCQKGSDPAYYSTIQKMAQARGNITFFGGIAHTEVIELIHASNLFLLTSESEGDWPMTVLESAANGLPVISLHINIEQSLDIYQFGIFCHSDISRMYDGFKSLVSDPAILHTYAENAQSFISTVHDVEENTATLIRRVTAICAAK